MRIGHVSKCFHWSFSSWLILNNIKCLCTTARPSCIVLVSSSLLHKRCSSRKRSTTVALIVQAGQSDECFYSASMSNIINMLWLCCTAGGRGWLFPLGGGKCTPAQPHPVNTLMHLRTLTSIIISLHIVPVFKKACSKLKTEWQNMNNTHVWCMKLIWFFFFFSIFMQTWTVK